MPLEISEIDISVRVGDAGRKADVRQAKVRQEECGDVNREELVDDCVRRVLQILKTLGGR